MKKGFALLRPAGKQSGVMYFAVFALCLLSMVFSAFLGEQIALFSEHPTSFMNPGEFYATFALAVASIFAAFFIIRRNFRLRISWPWFVLFLVLGIGNLIGTFAFGTHFSGTTIYRDVAYDYDLTFTVEQRWRYVLCFFLACVHFYMVFAVFPKVMPHTRWLRILCWIGFLFALSAIVYSLIVERDLYAALFDPSRKIEGTWMLSFTNNENTFGYLILMGVIALCILHNGKSRLYYWVLILALGAMQLLVLSATAIVCTWLLIVSYGIYRYVLNVAHKPVRSTITLLFLIGVVITLSVLIFADPFGPNSFFGKIHAEIASYFGKRSNTFDTRVRTWRIVVDTVSASPIALVCGIGDFQSRMYLAALHVPIMERLTIYPAHNALMQSLIDGGLIRLFVYIVVVGRFFYVAAKRVNGHSKIAMVMILCFVTTLLHGFMESTLFLAMDTKGSSLLLLCFLPLEVESFHASHPKLATYLEACKGDAKKVRRVYEVSPTGFAKIAFFYLTPLMVLGAGVGALASSMGYLGMTADWSYYGIFLASWLIAPLGYLGIGTKAKRKGSAFWYTVLILTLMGAGIGLMWWNVWAPRIAFIAIVVLGPLPFVFRAKTASIFLPKALKTAYLPHLLIGASLCGLTLLGLLVPAQQWSLQIIVSSTLAILFLYPCFVAIPRNLKLGYPLYDKLHHLDCRILALSLIREEKLAKKQFRRLDPTYTPPHEKRIYLTHPW